ncbi:MAG: NTP transferase domain-containing protein [Gemmatimonadaceae bacterium]
MQAVILAAGLGSRLKPVTGGTAKALIEVGGRPLILHQLEALADHGVGPVLVIGGHQADELQKVVGQRAEMILNERFVETNSLYSLWLAREWIKGPFVLLNCDLLFDPQILDRLLAEKGSVLAYDSTSSRGREQTKVAIKDGRVVDIGKDVPPSAARGESIGMLKFDADGARAMLRAATELIENNEQQAWVIAATRVMCSQVPLYAANIAGHPWAEIDFPYDLDVARREVWPAISKGRWRQRIHWRRTRWAAVAVLAGAMLIGGWAASTRVGPASIDWEAVPVAGVPPIHIERFAKRQQWWDVAIGQWATAQLDSGLAVIDTRLVLPPDAPQRPRYVVAVTVDGRPYDWEAFTAQTDTSVRLTGSVLGDRDQIALTLGPGSHTVGVTLVDGHARRMLVRMRKPQERED